MTDNIRPSEVSEIITDKERLEEVSALLLCQKELAVDLEMDSLHHYREKVCLIQVSTRHNNWLIDPLAIKDITPLAKPFGNPDILVVMHGADYDIRSLHRDFGIEVSNLFDTMIAARFLGLTEFGLAALLRTRFSIELDKKYQKADWSKRPLSPEMLAYASADTANLLPLYDQLLNELIIMGRLDWVVEECALVSKARVNEKDGPLFLSCKGAGKLKNRSLAILEELLVYRDQQAQISDCPPFKIITTETLLELAEKRPHNISDLLTIKGMTQKHIQRHANFLLTAIASGLDLDEAKLPSFPRKRKDFSEGAKERVKELKTWREKLSAACGLDPGVVSPNWLLEVVADINPLSGSDLDGISGMRKWQKGLYGKELLMTIAAGRH